MTMNHAWREVYRAALLEIQPEEMRRRIDAAEKAIFRKKRRAQTDGLRIRRGTTGNGGRIAERCDSLPAPNADPGPPWRRMSTRAR